MYERKKVSLAYPRHCCMESHPTACKGVADGIGSQTRRRDHLRAVCEKESIHEQRAAAMISPAEGQGYSLTKYGRA
jgi:hypothetical protein